MTARLTPARASAVNWARDFALPLWAERGWDARNGGFVERLDRQGKPDIEAPRRVRVQARQVYVYAHAAVLGWHDGARELSLKGFDWFLDHCRPAQGGPGFIHIVGSGGAPVDCRIDAYDQAFGLLALGWIFRLTGDAQVRSLIDEELAFQDEHLADPLHGGWLESVPATLPRRQNPQMHAFEAMLGLYEATGEQLFLDRAARFLSLLNERLFDAGSGSLLEYFDANLRPLTDSASKVVEPGHHFEWTWLLLTYARLAKTAPPPLAKELYDWSMRHGLDASGCAVDEVYPDGAPRLSSRRLWPQTELIKANLALQEAVLEDDAASRADEGLERLSRLYLSVTPNGGWIDRYGSDGAVSDARMPASTFYHIFCAIAEAARV
jgi:mannose-6-phosphate isomerase